MQKSRKAKDECGDHSSVHMTAFTDAKEGLRYKGRISYKGDAEDLMPE
jgi:hypothetical protein